MMQAPLPLNENQRLAALMGYNILDTEAEAAFDDLTKLAAYVCGTPIALISLLDSNRQWFKSRVGLGVTETNRDVAFCAHAILAPDVFEVPDALRDWRFADNPLVLGEPHIRSYHGVPLVTDEGHALGTLCVLDHIPKNLTEPQIEALSTIARQVMSQLELRRSLNQLAQTMAERQQTEAEYRDLFEHAVEGLYRTTTTGSYLKANPMMAQILGYASAEELMATVIDIEHQFYVRPAQRQRFVRQMQARGWVANFESQAYCKNGDVIWILENARVLCDSQGQLVGYEGSVTDISDRKRTEQRSQTQYAIARILARELHLEAGMAKIMQAICGSLGWATGELWLVNDQNDQLHSVATWCQRQTSLEDFSRLTQQFPLSTGIGIPQRVWQQKAPNWISDVSQADYCPRADYAVQAGLHSAFGFPIVYGGRVLGVMVFFSTQVQPLDEDLRNMLMAAGSQIGQFIQRKQAEQALQNSERRFRTLSRFAPVGIFLTNAEGHCSYVNDRWCQVAQLSPQEALGDRWATTVHPEDRQRVLDEWEKAVQAQREFALEFRYLRTDSSVAWVFSQAMPLLSNDSQITGFIGTVSDITAHKQAEVELQSQNLALEQARQLADRANQAKSDFLATMSHEIRTPMNAVIGMTGLLLNMSLTATQREYIEIIRSSGELLLTLINDILDFSKIESGKLELEQQPFNLFTCLEEALDLLAPNAAQKGLELAYLAESDVPAFILGDVTRLRQILVNLLNNAIKFTEAGEVVVAVTARQLEAVSSNTTPIELAKPLLEIQFAVRDTGIGIPADKRERLFKAFSQVDSSTTRHHGGTGLGLAISRRLSELMGGKIWVESQPGVGSTFYFTITAAANPNAERSNISGSLAGRQVLIVDDNAINRHILSRHAHQWQMRSVTAASGAEALELLQQNSSFDLAILDMQMPAMDGLMLATHIQALPGSAQLPLVMLTSMGNSEHLTQQEQSRFAAFLNKPVKPAQLYATLTHLFQAQPPLELQSSPDPQVSLESAAKQALRILLAEDHLVNQKLALLMLQRLGYRADVVGNGLEVLEALQRQPYDVVLLDVQMPEMDGLEAASRIHQTYAPQVRPHLVAMTANAMQGDREKCLNAGMHDYISKPIRLEELAQVLSECRPLQPPSEHPASCDETTSDPSVTPSAVTFDPLVLENLREAIGDDDGTTVAELIDFYLTDTPPLLRSMKTAVLQQDLNELQRFAHSLKSSSASLGIMRLSQLCRRLEELAPSGNVQEAASVLENLDAEYHAVERAIANIPQIGRG